MGTRWCQQTQLLCLRWPLALHPAPARWWDPGCSVSHWTKAASSPIPRQTELLMLCWHRLGARRLLPGQKGGARSPGSSGRGPSPERARLSSAENMTSAEASAKGKTFLSCTAGRQTQFTGPEKAPGLQQEERGQAERPVSPALCLGSTVTDGWHPNPPLQMGGRSLCGGTEQAARPGDVGEPDLPCPGLPTAPLPAPVLPGTP